jgi:glycosyltransferase involved in cell wall biosynthesis
VPVSSLRILQVSPYYADAWAYGGVPRAATALCEALAGRGLEVTVCTTDVCDRDTRAHYGEGSRQGVRIHAFPNRSNRLAYHWQVFTPSGLSRFLQTNIHRFDIVHIHAHRHLLEWLAARACRRAGVPYVLTPNGTAPRIERRLAAKAVFDALAGHRALRGAAVVTAVSHAEIRQLAGLGVAPGRVRLLPNPVRTSEFAHAWPLDGERARVKHDPFVLFLGKLTPRKSVDTLVRAVSTLDRPATLVIAGNDMGSEKAIRRLVRDLGMGNRVRFLGLLRGPERARVLAGADLVAYPSRDEIFGLVAVEALLCGTPVVVGRDSGCGEVVRAVGGGLLVEPGNHLALASALARMLADLPSWRDAARKAGSRLRPMVEAETVAALAESIYREAIGHRTEACA